MRTISYTYMLRAVWAIVGIAIGAVAVLLFEQRSLIQMFNTAKLSAGVSGTSMAAAECVPSPSAAQDDVFFISCGGIY